MPWEGIQHEVLGVQYAQSFFWAVMVTSGIGYDVAPYTNLEVRSSEHANHAMQRATQISAAPHTNLASRSGGGVRRKQRLRRDTRGGADPESDRSRRQRAA